MVAVAKGASEGERGVGNEIWLRVHAADDSHTPEIWVLVPMMTQAIEYTCRQRERERENKYFVLAKEERRGEERRGEREKIACYVHDSTHVA